MRKISILTLMVFALIVSILLGGVQNSKAEANEAKLNGTYAFNATMICNVAGTGPGPTLHLQGLLMFDGAGNGESDYISTNLSGEYKVWSDTDTFKYSVDEYNYFTITQDIILELAPNVEMKIENVVDEGWLGHGGQTLVISSNSKEEELPSGQIRWCVRSGTAVKVPKL